MENKEKIKKFVFEEVPANCTSTSTIHNLNRIEIFIPELLQGSYSFYTWPSAPVLAWYLWKNRGELKHKRILEIGSGTGLPGILAAKCGAVVTLSDSISLPKSLQHLNRCCAINGLTPNEHIRVVGLTWGLFFGDIDSLGALDFILASDCFYDPLIFEDILVTVSYLLKKNRPAKCLCTYQERSSDWSIEHLLSKWDLQCRIIDISNLIKQIDIGSHSILLLEISLKAQQ